MKTTWIKAIRMRKGAFGLLVFLLAASLGLMLRGVIFSPVILQTANIVVGDTTILVEVADEPKERAQGLSGRNSLSPGQGMVFLFEQPGKHGFWMKDMNFSLDFIWITDGKVVEISENIAPAEINQKPTPFFPSQSIEAVLEVPAGYAKSQGWQIGTSVIIED